MSPVCLLAPRKCRSPLREHTHGASCYTHGACCCGVAVVHTLTAVHAAIHAVAGLCVQVILPSGMILDARYRLGGSNGKAAFVG